MWKVKLKECLSLPRLPWRGEKFISLIDKKVYAYVRTIFLIISWSYVESIVLQSFAHTNGLEIFLSFLFKSKAWVRDNMNNRDQFDPLFSMIALENE